MVAVAPNWQTLLAGRLLAGMGASGCLTVLFTYVMEIIPPHQRLFLRGFFNWGWGRLILTVVAYLLPYWRHLATFFALLPLPLILFFAFVMPESPIWLASHGRSVQLHVSQATPDSHTIRERNRWRRVPEASISSCTVLRAD